MHVFGSLAINLFPYVRGRQSLIQLEALISLTPTPKGGFNLYSICKKGNIPYDYY
jgi:hypothetical protein